MYNDEGQYSSVGSLEHCSILEADHDLAFLDDLDPKLAILATVCSPPPPKLEQVEQIVKSVDTSIKSESSVAASAVRFVQSDQPAPQQSTITSVTETINKSESINTSPTLLVQQQPLFCLVEHQAPSTVILTEEPVQGMYLINGLAGTQGLVLQGGNILQNAIEQQGMYLINGMAMFPGNIMLGNCPNLVNSGGIAENVMQQLQDTQPEESKDKTGV